MQLRDELHMSWHLLMMCWLRHVYMGWLLLDICLIVKMRLLRMLLNLLANHLSWLGSIVNLGRRRCENSLVLLILSLHSRYLISSCTSRSWDENSLFLCHYVYMIRLKSIISLGNEFFTFIFIIY